MKNSKKTSKTTFLAQNIPVLYLTYEPDKEGYIIPPEAIVYHENPIPIVFDFDDHSVIGNAYVTRVGNKLLADLEMYSLDKDIIAALAAIQSLYPAVRCSFLEGHENIAVAVSLDAISVSYRSNEDPNIRPLGEAVKLYRGKDDLH